MDYPDLLLQLIKVMDNNEVINMLKYQQKEGNLDTFIEKIKNNIPQACKFLNIENIEDISSFQHKLYLMT